MSELVLPIGIPGSGKSTYIDNAYKHNSYVIVCLDDMRLASGSIFNPYVEPMLKGILDIMVRSMMIRKQKIVLDSTNVNYNITKNWVNTAKKYDYKVTLLLMMTEIYICKERQTKNVPEEKMDHFIIQMEFLIEHIRDLNVDKIIEIKDGYIKEWKL